MLTWETKINTTPTVTTKAAHLAEEPSSNLYEYYVDADLASDRSSLITLGNYVDPHWSVPARHLTSQKVKRIGIKHFPQVGAIGFFTYLNEERSKIIAPIHVKSKKYTAPSITVTENETSLIVVISPPIDYGVDKSDDMFSDGSDIFDDGDNGEINTKIKYICHRIILRLDKFAIEYITYENTIDIPKPVTTGTYDIYCVGYIHEGEAVSEDSNHVYLDITGTRDTWPGPVEGSDLFITDVEVTDENKVHIRRSDGFQKDSDNLIPVPVSTTFLDSNRLLITFNNGQTVISNNAPSGSGGGGGGSSSKILLSSYIQTGLTSAGNTLQGTLVNCKQGSDILLIVITRSDLTVPNGYTLIQHVDPIVSSLTEIRQSIYVYKKSVLTTGDEDLTVTQSGTSIAFAMLAINLINLTNITIGSIVNANIEAEEVDTLTVTKEESLAITIINNLWAHPNTRINKYEPNDNCLLIDDNAKAHFVIDNSNFLTHNVSLAENKSSSSASKYNVTQAVVINLG